MLTTARTRADPRESARHGDSKFERRAMLDWFDGSTTAELIDDPTKNYEPRREP